LKEMVEDELTFREPKYFMGYLLAFWGIVGVHAFWRDFSLHMEQVREAPEGEQLVLGLVTLARWEKLTRKRA